MKKNNNYVELSILKPQPQQMSRYVSVERQRINRLKATAKFYNNLTELFSDKKTISEEIIDNPIIWADNHDESIQMLISNLVFLRTKQTDEEKIYMDIYPYNDKILNVDAGLINLTEEKTREDITIPILKLHMKKEG